MLSGLIVGSPRALLFEGGLGMMPNKPVARGGTPEPDQRLIPFKGFSIVVAAKAVRAKPCKPWRCPSGAPARQHVP